MKRVHSTALLYLGLGTLLFALGPAVLKLLTTMGGRFGVSNPGAISFCNVLFVGNFCAGLVTASVFGARRLGEEYRALARPAKLVLLVSAILSAVYPALIFTALERTTVINVVLLTRFNGIVFVALAFVFFRTRVRASEAVGYAVIASGVLGLVFSEAGGTGLGSGEILVLVSTIFFALTEFVSKNVLTSCSIELYVSFRNFVSAALFFAVAVYLYGFVHFAEAFEGELWLLMFVYAGLAVVAAQVSWLKATRVLPVRTIASSQLLNPAFSIVFAFLLLGEAPNERQWTAMAIVLAGTLIPWAASTWRVHAMRRTTLYPGLSGTH